MKLLTTIAAVGLLATACGGGNDNAAGGGTDTGGGGGGEVPISECRDQAPDVTAGSESLDGANITVGSKDFDEQLVLGNITKAALESAGVTVDDQINLGGTNVAREALKSGEIDVYWDYTGTGWISFFAQSDPIPDRQQQYEAVRNCDWARNQLVWMEPAPFNNTYGIAYRSEAADELGNPQTLSDLGPLLESNPDEVTLCTESEFPTRNDGLPGMEEHYGYTIPDGNISTLDTGVIYTSVDRGDPCNFGEVFTTDGRINALGLTVLEDDKSFFPLYNAGPIFRGEVYEQYGQALQDLFNPIAEALTQEQMTELNKRVSSDGESAESVAKDFLESNGLMAS